MPEKPITLAADAEKRSYGGQFEVRDAESTAPIIEGYASTFNQEYDMGAFREQVAPEAFNRTLANKADVPLLIDHDGQPLARTKSGTLELSTDSTGLHMRSVLDASDPDVQRLVPKMRRGDLDQMSFAFRVTAGGDSWSDDYSQRTLLDLNLNGGDVSVVTYPANPATSVAVRALDAREGMLTFADLMFRELRAGKAISAANMAKLAAVLDSLATADGALDEAQANLAAVLGVPNPDPGEPDDPQANSGRPTGLAQAIATRLRIAG